MKTILCVCVRNAGRSQMAESFTKHPAKERGLPVRALSAIAGEKINLARIHLSEDWGLDDPKDASLAQVRVIRHPIHRRVETLLSHFSSAPSSKI